MAMATETVQTDEGRRPGQYLVDHGLRWHLTEQVGHIRKVLVGMN
jgi:hypothetical protein